MRVFVSGATGKTVGLVVDRSPAQNLARSLDSCIEFVPRFYLQSGVRRLESKNQQTLSESVDDVSFSSRR
jgi:hypothetical protein